MEDTQVSMTVAAPVVGALVSVILWLWRDREKRIAGETARLERDLHRALETEARVIHAEPVNRGDVKTRTERLIAMKAKGKDRRAQLEAMVEEVWNRMEGSL